MPDVSPDIAILKGRFLKKKKKKNCPKIAGCVTNSVDPDQRLCLAASNSGIHYLVSEREHHKIIRRNPLRAEFKSTSTQTKPRLNLLHYWYFYNSCDQMTRYREFVSSFSST